MELEAGQGNQERQLNAKGDDDRPLLVVPQVHDIEKHACHRDRLSFGVNKGKVVGHWSGHVGALVTGHLRDAA